MAGHKVKPRPTPKRKPLHGAAPRKEMPEQANTHEEPREGARRGVGEPGREAGERAERTARVRGREPEPNPVREDERGPLQDWMCGARLRGERAGLLCRNPKMKGAARCRMHGSATLVAREKAQDLIIASTYPAVRKLRDIINDPDAPYSAVIAACRDLLDRAELAGTTKVEIEAPKFAQTLNQALRMKRPGGGDEDEDRYTEIQNNRRHTIIDGTVVEPERPALDPSRPCPSKPLPPPPPAARPEGPSQRVDHVNSDDTPPRSVAARTPGYQGGTRRTGSRITR